jgi:hypothetical protein
MRRRFSLRHCLDGSHDSRRLGILSAENVPWKYPLEIDYAMNWKGAAGFDVLPLFWAVSCALL